MPIPISIRCSYLFRFIKKKLFYLISLIQKKNLQKNIKTFLLLIFPMTYLTLHFLSSPFLHPFPLLLLCPFFLFFSSFILFFSSFITSPFFPKTRERVRDQESNQDYSWSSLSRPSSGIYNWHGLWGESHDSCNIPKF